ncbi:MAG: CHAD domain-containing protein [Methylacidiphilales bacterium]|nr:CHAD domain-containing protein [Candidatus Methylacidiphilales bacterium]
MSSLLIRDAVNSGRMSFGPFQLRPGEELRPGLIRIVDQIAKKSAALPGFRSGKADEAIHEARLLVKLLRALVWMARPALGRGVGQRIRSHLRAAASCLADPRDAAVLASTLSNLAGRVSGDWRRASYALAAEALSRTLTAPGDGLVRRNLTTSSHHLGQVNLLFRRGAEKTALPWPSATKRGRAAVRSCRKAMKRALSSRRADDFHQWRKKAKRLLFQLRVAEIAPDPSGRKIIELVDKLQARLGDHHDLVVLEEHLRKNSILSNRPNSARNVFKDIHRQKRAIEKRLIPLGRRCRRVCEERLKI